MTIIFIAAMLDYYDFAVASYEGGTGARLSFDAHIEVQSEASSFTLHYDTLHPLAPHELHLGDLLLIAATLHLAAHAKGSIHSGARIPPPNPLLRN